MLVIKLCSILETTWTVTHQAPLSVGFSRQEYLSVLPCPPPGDLSNPGIEPECLIPPSLAGVFFTTSATEMKVQMQLLISRSYLVSKRLLDGVDSAGTGSRLWLYFRVSTQLYIFSTPDHLCTKYWRETYAFIPKAMKICVQFVSLLLITALPGWRSLCNSMKL